MKRNHRNELVIRNTLMAILSLLVCLGVMELGLRTYDAVNGRSFFSTATIIPYRIFGSELYDKTGDDLRIRSHHGEIFSFTKPADTIRIVTFGGSTSVNAAVFAEYGVHYSSLLQERLNNQVDGKAVEVINVANEAYATTHSITMLAFDVLSWDPDIVIMSHNVNDLHASFFPEFVPDYSNKYAHDYYSMPWFRQTCVNLRLCRTIRSRIEKARLIAHPARRKSYGPEPADLVQQVFARNVESFALLAKDRGIEVVVGSQPLKDLTEAEFDEDVGVKSYNDDMHYPLHDEFVSHHRRFNEIIETTAERLDIGYVDNDEIFGGNPDYFLDLVHYTKAGVERLAQNYEDVILSRFGDAFGVSVSNLN